MKSDHEGTYVKQFGSQSTGLAPGHTFLDDPEREVKIAFRSSIQQFSLCADY